MIVAMLEHASEDQIQRVTDHLMKMGFAVHRTTGARQSVLAAVGKRIDFDTRDLEVLPGVERVHRISAPYKLAGRQFHEHDTVVKLPNGVEIGGPRGRRDGGSMFGGVDENNSSLQPRRSASLAPRSCGVVPSSLAAHLTHFRGSDLRP